MARGAKSDDLILFGHSLGTGVATQMAEEFNVGGLILLAPYLSIAKMAQIKFPVFPAGFIVFDRFDNFKKDQEYSCSCFDCEWSHGPTHTSLPRKAAL